MSGESGNGGIDANPVQAIPGWKRAFDVGVVLLASPLWLPLMGAVALGIRVVSDGPIFFRQERIGHGGKPFTILKFRSMKPNAGIDSHKEHLAALIESDVPMTKLDARGDPRLIPFGRWLRASALDELPQLVNVLRGEMSLVGPRPCTQYEYAQYEPWHHGRFAVLPGLTGLWQVRGKNRTTFSQMIAMDIEYARRSCFRLDLAILGQTIPVVVRQLIEGVWPRSTVVRRRAGGEAVESLRERGRG
jgi:exopolysaccharide production protein ExoY